MKVYFNNVIYRKNLNFASSKQAKNQVISKDVKSNVELSEKEKKFIERKEAINRQFRNAEIEYQKKLAQEKKYVLNPELDIKALISDSDGSLNIDKLKTAARIVCKLDEIVKYEIPDDVSEKYMDKLSRMKYDIAKNIISIPQEGPKFNPYIAGKEFEQWLNYVNENDMHLSETLGVKHNDTPNGNHTPLTYKSNFSDDDFKYIVDSTIYKLDTVLSYNVSEYV